MTAWQNRIEAQELASPSSAKYKHEAEQRRLEQAVIAAAREERRAEVSPSPSFGALLNGRIVRGRAVDALEAFEREAKS
jgi:hypothetical protein